MHEHPLKYGITGGIGSGKSYVCHLLAEHGITVYDCDAAAKRLMRSDNHLQQQLSALIGKDVFPNGEMDKASLAQFLLASEENAKSIDAIVHPAVFRDFEASGINWVESAILFECGMNSLVDRTVCVVAPEDVRLQRIMMRDNISRDKALEWINRQMNQEEKAKLSDYVIINDGTTPLLPQLERIIKTK